MLNYMPYASWIDKRDILHLQLIRQGARKSLFTLPASVNASLYLETLNFNIVEKSRSLILHL